MSSLKREKNTMKITTKIWNNFITGVAVLLPTAITILILRFLVIKINLLFLEPMLNFFQPYLVNPYLIPLFKIMVFLIVIAIISLIGVAARIIVLRKAFGFGERLFIKVPMIGKVYNATKQISKAFLGQGRSIFKKVLLVEYPRKGTWSIGFMTEEMSGEIETKTGIKLISVFVPTTPNPTSGIYLLVPKEQITFLDMNVEEGLKLVISGGTVIP